ncbi:MAG: FAD-binding domain-containing protein [Verrucomicrobiales bacterium]
MHCVWFKKDLRVHDHRPLWEASQRGAVICVFVDEEEYWTAPETHPRDRLFLEECLAELAKELMKLGGRLVRRQGRLPDVFFELHREIGFTHLWSHEETGSAWTYARDLRVKEWCKSAGVKWTECPQTGVVRRLKSRDGWSKIWQQRMSLPQTPEPPSIRTPEIELFSTTPPPPLTGQKPAEQTGGRQAGLQCLHSFLQERGEGYRKEMSSPVTAWASCSRISPYLSFGCLSLREVYLASENQRAALLGAGKNGTRWRESLQSFSGRLRWHCHFMQKLEDEPEIEVHNIHRGFDGLREDDWSEKKFRAWCDGQTGYPMVDACMRALCSTGWLNFRMRAMLVSFASYHLWLHWRRPAQFLGKQFLDFEPGIHYSQFQMQSGVTGINTLRMYSPAKQVADHDPTGIFIRRWVPELEGVPDPYLAEPHKIPPLLQKAFGIEIGRDYPAPIVDHIEAIRHARARLAEWRRRPGMREISATVQKRHGSRKRSRPVTRPAR